MPVFVTDVDRVRVAVFGSVSDMRGELDGVIEAKEVFDTSADLEPVTDTKAVRDLAGLSVADFEATGVALPNDRVALEDCEAVVVIVVVSEFVLTVGVGVRVVIGVKEMDGEVVADVVAVPVIGRVPRGVFVVDAVAVEHRVTRIEADPVGDADRVRLCGPVRLPVGLDVGDAVIRKLVVGAEVAVVVFEVVTDAVFVFVVKEVAESVGLADPDLDGLIVAVEVPLTELVFVRGAVAV